MFTYSAWTYYWFTAVLVMTELVGLTLMVGALLSATVEGVVFAAVIGVLVLAVGWVLVTMLRLAPGKVAFSPSGVYHRGLASTHFVPWHAIVAVSADWIGTPIIAIKAFPSEDTRVCRYMGRFGPRELQFLPIMVVSAVWLATDPTTVYHALSFCQSNPNLRVELATPAALDRIGNGRAVGQER